MIAAFPSEIHTLFSFKSCKFIPERNRSQATNASQWFSLQVHIVVQNLKLPFGKSWTNSSLTQELNFPEHHVVFINILGGIANIC